MVKIGQNGNGGCGKIDALTDLDRATFWCSGGKGAQWVEFTYPMPCEADGYFIAGPKVTNTNKKTTGGCNGWYHPPKTWYLSADGKKVDSRNINKMGCDESGDTTWTMPENFNQKKGKVVAKKFRITMTAGYNWQHYMLSEMGITLNMNPRKVTPEEISTLKCTRANGKVSIRFTKGSKNQGLDFYKIAQNDKDPAAWYCDLTTKVPFSAVKAGYTLLQKDPETGKNQDPDDNWEMQFWGQKTTAHNGYFSMGTPNVIIETGGKSAPGEIRNTMVQAHHGKPIKLTFRQSKFDPSWHPESTIRFGFAQSAQHENFSIKDFDIMITPARAMDRGVIRKVVYQEGTSVKSKNAAFVMVRPNTKYRVSYSILKNDLGDAKERLVKATLDGKSLGGCKPPGGDYDCTFFKCSGTMEYTSKSGKANLMMEYEGHSKDCECNRRNWECFKEGKAPREAEAGGQTDIKIKGGYTPVTYAAEWVFTPVDVEAGQSNKHIRASLRGGVMQGDGQMRVFANTGKDQTFVVPKGVNRLLVKLWGAGGGAEHLGKDTAYGAGSGGFVTGWMKTKPGEKLTLVVGDGGRSGNTIKGGKAIYGMGGRGRCNADESGCTYTGAGGCIQAAWESAKYGREVGDGGGLAGIFRGSVSKGNAVAIAGGGAGASDGEAGEGASDRCDSFTESKMAGSNSAYLRRAGAGAGYCGGKDGSSGAEGGSNYAGGLEPGALNTAGQDGYYNRVAMPPGRHDIDYASPGLGYAPGTGYRNDCKHKQGGNAKIVLRWAVPDQRHAIFLNSGHNGHWKVPAPVREVSAKLWGAGGGSEHIGKPAWSGGSGGFVAGSFKVTPGEVLTVVAGDGGRSGNTVKADQQVYGFGGIGRCDSTQSGCTYTGQSVCLTENWESSKFGREVGDGGGLAGIFRGGPSQKSAIAVAGGGGGPTDGQEGLGASVKCGSKTVNSLQGQNSNAIRVGGGGGGYCGGKHAPSAGHNSQGGANFVGGLKGAKNVAGSTQASWGKMAKPPMTNDPDYIPGVAWGVANDCPLSGGRKAGGPALVVLKWSTKSLPKIETKGAIGIYLQNKKGIISFGPKSSASFFHDASDPGVVHFTGKDLRFKGQSLTTRGGRRLGAEVDMDRVQQLEEQVAVLQAAIRRLEEAQANK